MAGMEDQLTAQEKKILLSLGRQAMEAKVRGEPLTALDLEKLPKKLQKKGATFVTLTIHGGLRGCIGALEPYLPLAEDVREHAIAAATQDYRFPPVRTDELPKIKIEISRLTIPVELDYRDSDDLIRRLRPGIDGVIIRDGAHRATFLPQVWEKLPETAAFLSYLCNKMGSSGDLWRWKKIQVLTYQVEEFHE
jgi:AmmeMemoRadiSam system protein A